MRVNRASDDSQWWLAGDGVRKVTGGGMSVRLAVTAMTGFQWSGSKCQLGGWQGKGLAAKRARRESGSNMALEGKEEQPEQ